MTIGKRCLAMVVYDPAAEQDQQQRAAKRPRPSTASEAGVVVPYDAAAPPPVDAQPISAIPWRRPQAPPSSRVVAVGKEPPCLRNHILPALRLRSDLPLHFIDAKAVTNTDLDAHQNRFRIPTNGVLRRLRPLLTFDELAAANLLYDPEPRKKSKKKLLLLPEAENGVVCEQAAAGKKMKKKKRKGRVHGGLPVKLVDLAAGASWELRLSRWESSHGTIVKGEGYLDFIRRCSFKENDVVEIWAFKQHPFRNFGVTMCEGSILHVFIVKRHNQPEHCRYCPHC